MNSATNNNFNLISQFFSQGKQELELREELISYEMLFAKGGFDAQHPNSHEVIRRINLINDANFGMRKFLNKNQNFILALQAFADGRFIRRDLTSEPCHSNNQFLFKDTAILMHCVTAFYTQVSRLFLSGCKNHLKQEEKSIVSDAKKLAMAQYASEHFKNVSTLNPLETTALQHKMAFINHLNIKKCTPGASRKIAAVVFTVFFGNFFMINDKNQKYIIKILNGLFQIIYKDKSPDEAKIRSYIKSTIERAKCP